MNIMPTEWLGKVLKLKRMKTVHHGMLGSFGSSFANPIRPHLLITAVWFRPGVSL